MSVLSKRHYAAVARAVKRRYEHALMNSNDMESAIAIGAILPLAVDLSRMFAEDNLAFDRTRFLLACGINTGAAKRGDVTATVNEFSAAEIARQSDPVEISKSTRGA